MGDGIWQNMRLELCRMLPGLAKDMTSMSHGNMPVFAQTTPVWKALLREDGPFLKRLFQFNR